MSAVALLTEEQISAIVERAVERALAARVEPPAEILSCVLAGKLVGRSAKYMEREARMQRCPAFRLGKQWRFRRGELLEWAERQRGQ